MNQCKVRNQHDKVVTMITERLSRLPTARIQQLVDQARAEIAAVRSDPSIRGEDRTDLLGDLFSDLSQCLDELEWRGA